MQTTHHWCGTGGIWLWPGNWPIGSMPFTVLEASEHIGVVLAKPLRPAPPAYGERILGPPPFPFSGRLPYLRIAFAGGRIPGTLRRTRWYKAAFQPKSYSVFSAIATDKTWQVQTETDLFTADRVVVATGYNRVPNVPELPGQRDFQGYYLAQPRVPKRGAFP